MTELRRAANLAVLVIVGLTMLTLWVRLDEARSTVERLQEEAAGVEAARLVALWKQQEKHDASQLAAMEAVKRYQDELTTLRAAAVRPSDGLRGAAKAYASGGGAEAAGAQCAGVQHRAASLGDLLDEADDLLGEAEGLAIESTEAAEQHAAEVRLLKSRVLADRQ